MQKTKLTNLQKIEKNPKYLLKIDNPTLDETYLAFSIKPKLMEEYDEIPEEIQFSIVEKDPTNVQYIKIPSKRLQEYIVSRGYKDFGNGMHYWNLIQKHNSIKAFLEVHPVMII